MLKFFDIVRVMHERRAMPCSNRFCSRVLLSVGQPHYFFGLYSCSLVLGRGDSERLAWSNAEVTRRILMICFEPDVQLIKGVEVLLLFNCSFIYIYSFLNHPDLMNAAASIYPELNSTNNE